MIPERFRGRYFLNEIRHQQINKAEREGRELLEEDVSFEAHRATSNKGRWPAGSIYLYAAECVYGPQGSAVKKERA